MRLEPGEEIRLVVQDDGVGLPRDRPEGVGLVSMRRRAMALGGDVSVSPGAGGGTRLEAVLPILPALEPAVPEETGPPPLAGVR